MNREYVKYCFLLMLTALLVQPVAAYQLPLSGSALVSFLEGQCWQVKDGQKIMIKQGSSVQAPADIEVAQSSRLELTLAEGSRLRFDGGTKFTLITSDVAADGSRNITSQVTLGHCWAWVRKKLGLEGKFEVNSLTAVAGVSGTVYRLQVTAENNSLYYVYDGRINVSYNPYPVQSKRNTEAKEIHRVSGPQRVAGPHRVSIEQWEEIVSKGIMLEVAPDGKPKPSHPFDLEQDKTNPWVRWNLEQDSLISS